MICVESRDIVDGSKYTVIGNRVSVFGDLASVAVFRLSGDDCINRPQNRELLRLQGVFLRLRDILEVNARAIMTTSKKPKTR